MIGERISYVGEVFPMVGERFPGVGDEVPELRDFLPDVGEGFPRVNNLYSREDVLTKRINYPEVFSKYPIARTDDTDVADLLSYSALIRPIRVTCGELAESIRVKNRILQ